MRFIDATTIRSIPYTEAMSAIVATFSERVGLTERVAVSAASGELLLMPATSSAASGVKLVTVTPNNADTEYPVVQAVYTLFDGRTGTPVAVLDGTALTTLRTAAVSALYSRALARPESTTLGVFGAGVQAESHIRAHVEGWSLDDIVVTARRVASVARLIARCQDLDAPIRAGRPDEVAGCDIVCGCTSSPQPIVPTAAIRQGTHLNLIGAYRLDMREAAADLMGRSSVYIEELHAAQGEAGDISQAVDEGTMTWDDVQGDLFDLAAGRVARRSTDEITLFKGVGLALEDLAVATAILAGI